jgi:hypothetical protein
MSNQDEVVEVEILVNERPTKIAGHHPTGHHIKQSAIEQGVDAQLDFILERVTEAGTQAVEDHERLHLQPNERFVLRPREIVIVVNERDVKVQEHPLTGRAIKQAAISQGVPIELGFVLSEELGDRRSRVVGDDDMVHVHKHLHFIAVAPDDNS